MSGEIPRNVERYVTEHIDSVPEIEIMMVLYANPEEKLGVEQVARRVYVSVPMAAALLTKLVQDGVATTLAVGDVTLYHYRPATGEVADIISQVARAYREALIPLTQLIHSKPNAALRHFADAFRIKKDE